jgi:hypothetical protein
MNVVTFILPPLLVLPPPATAARGLPPSERSVSDRLVQASAPAAGRTPVLVELFTSEGCSTCPPADQFLMKLDANQPVDGAEVIALEEHVDYWNQGGWTDPYSATEWTRRQLRYVTTFSEQGPYTPEMVVDGKRGFVGSEEGVAYAAIRESAHAPEVKVLVSVEEGAKDKRRLHVRVDRLASQESGEVFLAVAEDGLASSVTKGENAGKTLQHAPVLRSLQKIGTMGGKPNSPPFEARPEVSFQSRWNKDRLRIVVFVQDSKTLQILGAAATRIAG